LADSESEKKNSAFKIMKNEDFLDESFDPAASYPDYHMAILPGVDTKGKFNKKALKTVSLLHEKVIIHG